MRVIHVSPTAFGHGGLFGGGERYPVELVKALVRLDGVDCELVTFGPAPAVEVDDGVRVRVLRTHGHLHHHPAHPLAPSLISATRGADVIHVHHLRSTPSRACAVIGAVRRTPVAVTDHGLGGGDWMGLLPRLFDAFLTVSRYSSEVLRSPPEKTTVV